ncbi:hypothetical protein N658DRAFT_309925 [Parathielavia hyrcaniae]|uniref:Uncharacterized protein n=1 Tax=Parathielavia hyrcaniae TaxID=113614 RepID=A0AAN6Q7V0_9PEZI|nr:hypothetical protein N658DRAFT_309925 [Parathielavia hyrcaniae]
MSGGREHGPTPDQSSRPRRQMIVVWGPEPAPRGSSNVCRTAAPAFDERITQDEGFPAKALILLDLVHPRCQVPSSLASAVATDCRRSWRGNRWKTPSVLSTLAFVHGSLTGKSRAGGCHATSWPHRKSKEAHDTVSKKGLLLRRSRSTVAGTATLTQPFLLEAGKRKQPDRVRSEWGAGDDSSSLQHGRCRGARFVHRRQHCSWDWMADRTTDMRDCSRSLPAPSR